MSYVWNEDEGQKKYQFTKHQQVMTVITCFMMKIHVKIQ